MSCDWLELWALAAVVRPPARQFLTLTACVCSDTAGALPSPCPGRWPFALTLGLRLARQLARTTLGGCVWQRLLIQSAVAHPRRRRSEGTPRSPPLTLSPRVYLCLERPRGAVLPEIVRGEARHSLSCLLATTPKHETEGPLQ